MISDKVRPHHLGANEEDEVEFQANGVTRRVLIVRTEREKADAA